MWSPDSLLGRVALFGLLLAVVSGCGFHLRGWDLRTNIDTVHISSAQRSLIGDSLKQAVRQADVTEVPDPTDADVVITVLNERRDRRSVSVNRNARVSEYELQHEVLYTIKNKAGLVLSPPQWIGVERTYQVDRENVVGTSEEQALIEKEMRDDLVQQIFRTLNTVTDPGEQ
jgi:LPS-assembly lipoprotein